MRNTVFLPLLLALSFLLPVYAQAAPAGKLILTLGVRAEGNWKIERVTHSSKDAVCDPLAHSDASSSIRCWGNWFELIFRSQFRFSLKNTIVNKRDSNSRCIITINVVCDYDKWCAPDGKKLVDESTGFVCGNALQPILLFDGDQRSVHYQLGY